MLIIVLVFIRPVSTVTPRSTGPGQAAPLVLEVGSLAEAEELMESVRTEAYSSVQNRRHPNGHIIIETIGWISSTVP